jgi:hypothetical protein
LDGNSIANFGNLANPALDFPITGDHGMPAILSLAISMLSPCLRISVVVLFANFGNVGNSRRRMVGGNKLEHFKS